MKKKYINEKHIYLIRFTYQKKNGVKRTTSMIFKIDSLSSDSDLMGGEGGGICFEYYLSSIV